MVVTQDVKYAFKPFLRLDTSDPNAKVGSLFKAIRFIRMLGMFFNTFFGVAGYFLLLTVIAPLRYFSMPQYWQLEGKLFQFCICAFECWFAQGKLSIIESGASNEQVFGKRGIMMLNHQDTADIPLLIALLTCHNIAPSTNILVDNVFKYSHFGLVCQTHGDYFIRQETKQPQHQIDALQCALKDTFAQRQRTHFVLFPEGGLLVNRLPKSRQYAERLGLPIMDFVALPRVGAFSAAVLGLKESVDHVVDLTIAYDAMIPLNVIDLGMALRPRQVHIHYRVFPIREILAAPSLQQWLYDRYVEKDALLKKFQSTGRFVDSDRDPSLRLAPLAQRREPWVSELTFLAVPTLFCYAVVHLLSSFV